MNGIKEVLPKQKTVLVLYNRPDRQPLSLKTKAQQVKTYEGDLQNWGSTLTVITKETVQAKDRDNKIKRKEVLQTLSKMTACSK